AAGALPGVPQRASVAARAAADPVQRVRRLGARAGPEERAEPDRVLEARARRRTHRAVAADRQAAPAADLARRRARALRPAARAARPPGGARPQGEPDAVHGARSGVRGAD